MSALLGWTYSGRERPATLGVHLVPKGAIAEVHGLASPLGRRDWLSSVQACFRGFDVFLPNRPGTEPPDLETVWNRLAALQGLGQLHLRMTPPAQTDSRRVDSGRAYLLDLRNRRTGEAAWRDTAADLLERVARQLPSQGRRMSHRGPAVSLDVLVPLAQEPGLGGCLSRAIATSRRGLAVPGEVTASGLWAPVAFAWSEGGGDG